MVDALVSVIIPVYNRENTIKRAIDSVLCQTYTNLELIIVDDGSTDNTVKVVKEYTDQRIKLICQRKNGGANKARNIGIASAKGEYIAFQDSDDEWIADKLVTQIRAMAKGDYLACYSAYNLHERYFIHTIPDDFENQIKYETALGKILTKYNVIGTPTLVVKREALMLLENEYFDEQMIRLQDYEFAIRLHKICRIAYVNRPLVNAFRTADSITTNSSVLYASAGRIIKKHKDFLDMERFIEAVIGAEAGVKEPQKLVDDLNTLQISAGLIDKECKDRMFMRICRKYNIQNNLLFRQYQLAVERLQDRKFSIYGAGKIGKEVYYGLKRRGLRPFCFLVTKCDEEQRFIDDIPIFSIDDYQNKEDMVIISITADHQAELMENLITRNYQQFCVYHKELE